MFVQIIDIALLDCKVRYNLRYYSSACSRVSVHIQLINSYNSKVTLLGFALKFVQSHQVKPTPSLKKTCLGESMTQGACQHKKIK